MPAKLQALAVHFLFGKDREVIRLRSPALNSVSQSKLALFNKYGCKLIAQTYFHLPSLLVLVHIMSHLCLPPSLSQQPSQAFLPSPLSTTENFQRMPLHSA